MRDRTLTSAQNRQPSRSRSLKAFELRTHEFLPVQFVRLFHAEIHVRLRVNGSEVDATGFMVAVVGRHGAHARVGREFGASATPAVNATVLCCCWFERHCGASQANGNEGRREESTSWE